MVEFRSCPRCRGDIHVNKDMYGEYKQCLQCGHTVDIERKARKERDWTQFRERPGRKRKKAA